MKKTIPFSKSLPILISVILFVSVLLFFGLCYPHHLHFQEQYQLFLFDSGYVADVLSMPGGVADLFGRFLTQFFLQAWTGATIVAVLLAVLFLLLWRASHQGWLQGLSLIPVFASWVFFCDENALLGAIVALLLALLADWAISSVGNDVVRRFMRLFLAPLLYWALGPVAIVATMLGWGSAMRSHNKTEMLFAVGAMLVVVLMPLLAQYWVDVPLKRLYLSPHYHRDPLFVPSVLWLAALFTALVPCLPSTSSKRWLSISICAVVAIVGGINVKKSYNAASEEVMSYDFMARFQQWNRILETANKKKPSNAISCTALNLALAMKGQLANRMFDYNQNGMFGLLPDFQRDPISPLTTSEVYYQLGLINTAQRYVFEAQEAIQDYQKSGRCYRRLAETNLICGNYEVARKYLLALSKTLNYRSWAQERLALLYDEEAIARHEEYGRLRAALPDSDYFFHDRDYYHMLGRQIQANDSNFMAHQYLLGACMLNRDLYWYQYYTQKTDSLR